MDFTPHRQAVARALKVLDTNLERLVDALAHRPVWLSIEGAASDRDAVQRLCTAYASINYATHDDNEISMVCCGVAGVTADILKRADAVNTAKASLRTICAPLQGIFQRVPVKGDDGPTKPIPLIRVILRSIQRSDLNLLAAYHKIPNPGGPPISVTYTRAIYRKTIDEIHTLLLTMEGAETMADRARLETLDPHETHLALVKQRYQNMRANVLFTRLDRRGRMQISAELPVTYATGRHSKPPEVTFPVPEDDASTKPARGRESQLDAEPFLKSLPVWRYAK
jgi:hypothetical protein